MKLAYCIDGGLRLRQRHSVLLALLTIVIGHAAAQAQKPPPETIQLPIPNGAEGYESVKVEKPKLALNEKGHAFQARVSFPMIERESVALEVQLDSPGRFDVELENSKSTFRVSDVRTENGIGYATLTRKFPLVNEEEFSRQVKAQLRKSAGKDAIDKATAAAARQKMEEVKRYLTALEVPVPGDDEEMRETYALIKAFEKRAEFLRDKLNESARAHPRWFTPEEKKVWENNEWFELFSYYRNVVEAEVADDNLTKWGFEFDRSTRNAVKGIKPLFLAVHKVASGATQEAAEAARVRQSISGAQMSLISKFLTVDLRLSVYSESESTDPNSQWFNAQRVACRAAGVASIRVEGTLDPTKGDNVDWWIIDRWDPGSIQFVTSTEGGVQFDPPKVEDGAARLHIQAGGKPVRYWFEMRSDKGDLKVTVHESHIPAESKFPY